MRYPAIYANATDCFSRKTEVGEQLRVT